MPAKRKTTMPEKKHPKDGLRPVYVYLPPDIAAWLDSIIEERGLTGERGAIQPVVKEKLIAQMRLEAKSHK